MSDHPDKIIRRPGFLVVVGAMAERAVVVVPQVPSLEAFSVEYVQAFQIPDLVGAEDGLEADDAVGMIRNFIKVKKVR